MRTVETLETNPRKGILRKLHLTALTCVSDLNILFVNSCVSSCTMLSDLTVYLTKGVCG